MSWDSKVLWTEGLFLQPHHFQQADRYTEALVSGLARRIRPYGWGVSALEIDDEVLKVGQFALKSVSGLTHDGTGFRVPMTDDHPPALEVPTRASLLKLYRGYTLPYHTVPYRNVPHGTALHCTALHCTALHYAALCCTALHHTAPHHTTPHHITPR